ncbi:kinase-like domain-containing protein [Spinellus fusiger]|nr:kinase-like domain-containing protein [Spinellus fusiger]
MLLNIFKKINISQRKKKQKCDADTKEIRTFSVLVKENIPKETTKPIEPSKSIGVYTIGRTIGKGSMGKVVAGIHTVTGNEVAIKIINLPKNKDSKIEAENTAKKHKRSKMSKAIQEGQILSLLNHPHIVKFYDFFIKEEKLNIIMECVPGVDLMAHLRMRRRLPEEECQQLVRQLASALDYLHRNSIVHRDLKLENIMVDVEGKTIKLVDFGLSNLFRPERMMETFCGSLYSVAPEMLHNAPYYGPTVDIWSFGVILFALATGKMPFNDLDVRRIRANIKSAKVNYPSHLSIELVDLLSRIFTTDPLKRINMADIIRHSWMNGRYQPVTENYLPVRDMLEEPLKSEVIALMAKNFTFGTEETIAEDILLIIQSSVYQDAAKKLYPLHQENSRRILLPPNTTILSNNNAAEDNDPQTVPEAFHPLLSIYHLVQEQLKREAPGL